MQLMTRLPVPVAIPFTPPVLARSVVYYPLIGAIVGGLTVAAGWLLDMTLPPLPAAVLVVFVWTALSGALHLDGLMDTADGVLSHRSRERMLDIMKDSRVGAMGVMAAIFVLLFKISSIYTLLERGDWPAAAPVMLCGCAWSRWWVTAAMAWWPPARPGEGLAALFADVRGRHAFVGLAIQAAIVIACFAPFARPWQETALAALVPAALTLAAGAFVAFRLNRKLGGLTGDTYGAMIELLESLLLCSALWLVR